MQMLWEKIKLIIIIRPITIISSGPSYYYYFKTQTGRQTPSEYTKKPTLTDEEECRPLREWLREYSAPELPSVQVWL